MVPAGYRFIVRRAGVRSGHAIVERTRIGGHDVVAMTKAGASVDEVVGRRETSILPEKQCASRLRSNARCSTGYEAKGRNTMGEACGRTE